MTQILMPALSPTMEEGNLAKWLVKPGDNLLLDSGSTTMALARHLRPQRDITVMTNGLNIAWELAAAFRAVVEGLRQGRLKDEIERVVGRARSWDILPLAAAPIAVELEARPKSHGKAEESRGQRQKLPDPTLPRPRGRHGWVQRLQNAHRPQRPDCQ